MVFSSAVEFPASRGSTEVLINSPAAPGVPPRAGVSGRARGAAGLEADGTQHAQQHQQRDQQHCGMAVARRWHYKTGALPSGSQGPIKVSGAPALQSSSRAHRHRPGGGIACESLLRVRLSASAQAGAHIKEACGDNRLNSNQLIQRKRGEAKGIAPV